MERNGMGGGETRAAPYPLLWVINEDEFLKDTSKQDGENFLLFFFKTRKNILRLSLNEHFVPINKMVEKNQKPSGFLSAW